MSSITVWNIQRRRGDTYANVMQVKSATTGAVEDVTGRTYVMTIDTRRLPDDNSTQVFQITGSITDAANGVVAFAPSTLQADNSGSYYHDVQQTDGSEIRTVATGRYTMIQDISK